MWIRREISADLPMKSDHEKTVFLLMEEGRDERCLLHNGVTKNGITVCG